MGTNRERISIMGEPSDLFEGIVATAVSDMLKGHPIDEIVGQLQERGVAPGPVIAEAIDRLLKRAHTTDLRLAMHLEARREIFKRALSSLEPQHLSVALRTLQDLAKLEGFYDRQPDPDDDDDDEDLFTELPELEVLNLPVQ